MLTLVQLYNLGLVEQIDIFSGLSLPSGSPFDRTLIINSIIEKCGLNFPLYADPTVMKSAGWTSGTIIKGIIPFLPLLYLTINTRSFTLMLVG